LESSIDPEDKIDIRFAIDYVTTSMDQVPLIARWRRINMWGGINWRRIYILTGFSSEELLVKN
jgi:hypothetical protein